MLVEYRKRYYEKLKKIKTDIFCIIRKVQNMLLLKRFSFLGQL